jgi:hypothetical protein
VPIAFLAFLGIRAGIAPEKEEELHRVPIDITGAVLGTATIVFAIVALTLFIEKGMSSAWPWVAVATASISALLFVFRERNAQHPLIDAKLLSQPLVSGGLAYKAATGLAIAGLGYMISLQFQLDWGWSPLRASIAMLPQVATLLLSGFFVEKFVGRFGIHKAAWFGSLSVLTGLVIFGAFGQVAYIWVAVTLVLIAAGLRVVGVVAGVNVMNGTPKNRTSIGAALVDTTDEITSAISIAVSGTIIAAIFVGEITKGKWSVAEKAQFHHAASLSTWILTTVASALIGWAFVRTHKINDSKTNLSFVQ